jgi:hypothetical protein
MRVVYILQDSGRPDIVNDLGLKAEACGGET